MPHYRLKPHLFLSTLWLKFHKVFFAVLGCFITTSVTLYTRTRARLRALRAGTARTSFGTVQAKLNFSLATTLLLFAVLVSIGFSLINTGKTYAATAGTVNFQARLEQANGSIVPDGYYNVEFKLYNAATAGTALWTEDDIYATGAGNDHRIRVVNGYLTVNLGALTAFPTNINWSQDLYVSMNIGGSTTTVTYDGEMSPRLKLTAVPYAFSAGQLSTTNASGSTTLSFVAPTATNSIQLPDATGVVCLNNSAACGFASSSGSSAYIQNNTALQTNGNFNIQTNSITAVTATIQALTGQTADLLNFKNAAGTAPLSGINASGQLYYQSGSFTGTLIQDSILQNTVYHLPDPGATGTATLCLSTGNCAGSGGGITGSGTTNYVARFNSASTINASALLYDNGTFVGVNTITNNGLLSVVSTNTAQAGVYVEAAASATVPAMTIKGGATPTATADLLDLVRADGVVLGKFDSTGNLTLGASLNTTGTINFANTTNSQLVTLNSVAPSGTGNVVYRLPTAAGGSTYDLCTSAGNCAGSGSGATASGGVANYIAKFSAAQNITSASLYDDGTFVGLNTTVNNGLLSLLGATATQSTFFAQGTASASASTALIKAGTGQTGDFIDFQPSGSTTPVAKIDINGNITGNNGVFNGQLNVASTATFTSGLTSNGSITSTGNFSQTGATTFSTGTGAVSLNGNTSITGTLGVSGLTSLNGGLSVAAGKTFTNAGSTINSALAIADITAGGAIGTAAATVDVATTFNINQVTAGQTLTLPAPTTTTAGHIAYVSNVGTAAFSIYGVTASPGTTQDFVWNGTTWTVNGSGTTGNYIKNGTALQVGANFNIDGNGTLGGTLAVTGLASLNGGATIAANQNLSLSSGTGTITQGYTNGVTGTAQTSTVTNNNATATAATVTGQNLALVGGANTTAGANTINGTNYANVTPIANNTFNAINFGTGFNSLINYNGTQLLNGLGKLQNAAIDAAGLYTNLTGVGALSSGSITSGFGTISTANNITTTTAIQGGTLANTGSSFAVNATGNVTTALSATTGTTLVCQNATSQLAGCTNTYAQTNDTTNFIRNQTTQQASSNFNISGTGIATTLQAGTVDTSAAATLNIGTTNANALTVAKAGVATTIAGSLTATQGSTFNGNVSVAGASTLTVGTGATSLGGTLAVTGATTLGGTLAVTGLASLNGGATIAANQNLSLSSGTGTITQGYTIGVTGTAQTSTVTNNNATATAATVTASNIALVGGTNTNVNANTINGTNYANVTPIANNTFNAINFGTGFNSLINYNGIQLLSGAGKLQNAAIDAAGLYTNLTGVGALSSGSITSGFGTISTANNITTTVTLQGATVNATASINVGTATAAGAINVQDGSAHTVSIGSVTQANNVNVKFPADTNLNDTFCLVTLANCTSTTGASGTTNYVAKFTSSTNLGSSSIFDNGTFVGFNTITNSGLVSIMGASATQSGLFVQDAANASVATAVIKAATGQTGNLAEFQSSTGTVLAKIDASGNLTAGSATVTSLSDSGNASVGGTLAVTGNTTVSTLSASGVITSTVATGTAPLTVASTTLVTNLNADMVDGYHASSFALTTDSTNFIRNQTTLQTGNFNIQSAAAASVGGVIRGAASQTADLLQLQNSAGTVLAKVDASGNLTTANITAASGSFTSLTDTGNFSQTGTGTFSTGTGAISLNGNTTVTGTNSFTSGSGAVTLNGNTSIAGTNTLTVGTGATSLGGTLAVTGATTLSSTLAVTGNTTVSTLSASGVITSTVATGTAPLTVASTTLVTNLNADMLDGYHASSFALTTDSTNFIRNQTTAQAANFNVAAATGVAGVLRGAAGQDIAQFERSSDGTVVAKIDASGNLTAGTGTFSAVTGVSGNGVSVSETNTNTTATVTTTNNLNLNLTGSTNANASANVLNGVKFANVTPLSNNIFNGLSFGTGYDSLLQYNNTTLINGSGILQNSALSSAVSYSNLTQVGALSNGSIASGFGTISTTNNITTTATVQGAAVTATGALQGNSLSVGSGTFTVSNTGAITAATGINSSGSITFSGLTNAGAGGLITSNGTGLLASGTVNRDSSAYFSGTLSVANGGTGATTLAANGILYGNGTAAVAATATANNSVLITSATGLPSLSATLPALVQGNITALGAVTSGSIGGTFGTINTANNITTSTTVQGGSVTATGALTGNTLSIGGGTFAVNASGAITATTGIASSGAYTQTGTAANTFTGNTSLTSGVLNLGTAGTAAGNLVLANTSNTHTTTLTSVAPAGINQTITIPATNQGAGTDSICLLGLQNCTAVGAAGGDLTGTYPNPTIAKLQGTTLTVTSGTLASGQYLRYNGSAFVNSAIQASDLPSFAGTYLRNVPATTADNTVAPTAASVVGLTVKGTTAGATNVLEIFNSNATPTRQAFFDANGSLNVNQLIQPTTNNTVDLGLSATAFRNGYFGTSVNVGATTLNAGQLTFAAGGTVQAGAGSALTLNGNAASSFNTSAGDLTLQAGSGTVSLGSSSTLSSTAVTFNLINTAATTVNAFGAATAINVGAAAGSVVSGNGALTLTTATAASASAVTVQSGSSSGVSATGASTVINGGNATGTTSTGGGLILDAGTGTSSNGAINIGVTNASSISLGRSGVTTYNNGNLVIAAGRNLTLASGTGTISQTYSAVLGSAETKTLTNASAFGTSTVNGLNLNFSGTNTTGSNTNNAINLGNVTAPGTNNTYNGLVIGTGYANLIQSANFSVAATGNITNSGTYNTNSFTASSLQFGSAVAASVQSASGQALAINGTNGGNVTIGNSSSATTTITLQDGASSSLVLNSTGTAVTGSLSSSTSFSAGTNINAGTGYTIGGVAPIVGHFLRSNGTQFVDGTLQGSDAAGIFLRNVPATTADNTVAPTAASVVGLTVKGTTAGATNVLEIFNSNATPTRQAFFDANGSLNVNQLIQPTTANTLDIGLSATTFRSGYFGTSLVSAGSVLNGTSLTLSGGTALSNTSLSFTAAGTLQAAVNSDISLVSQGTGNVNLTSGSGNFNFTGAANTVNLVATAGQTTANIFNTVTTTANVLGAATTVNLSSAAAAATTLTVGGTAGTTIASGGTLMLTTATGINALTVQPGISSVSGSAAANLNLTAGNSNGAAAGSNGGDVVIDGGSSVNGSNGGIRIGTTTASSISLSRNGIPTTSYGNLVVAANQNLSLASGTGTIVQTFNAVVAGSAQTTNVTNSSTAGSVTMNGIAVNLTGTTTTGANVNNGLYFGNVTNPTATNNTFNGLSFGSGYSNLLTSANISVAATGNITNSGTYNTNSFTASSLQFGGGATANLQSAASQVLAINAINGGNVTVGSSASATTQVTLQNGASSALVVGTAGTTITGTLSVSSSINAGTAYKVGGSVGTNGQYLRSDGVNGFVASNFQASDAAGIFLRNVPATTADNTVAPTAASVVGLTVKGTTAGATNVLEIFNSNATPTRQAFFDANGSLNVNQLIQPTTNNTVDLGLSATAFRNGYFGTSVTSAGTLLNGSSLSFATGVAATIQTQGVGALTIQSGSGTISLGSNTALTTTGTSFNLFNSTVTSANILGAATAINLGATNGTITLGPNSTVNTTAGTLTLTGFAGITLNTPNATGATSNVSISSGNSTTSGNTGAISVTTGNATNGTAGNIGIDNGTSSTGSSQINIGTANARILNLGNATAATISTFTAGAYGLKIQNTGVNITSNATTGADLTLGDATNVLGRTISVVQAATGNGANLTIQAGAGAAGTTTGGNLLLQGGAKGSTGTAAGYVIAKANITDGIAFQVQNNAGAALFSANTSTQIVTIGASGTQNFSASGGGDLYVTGTTGVSGLVLIGTTTNGASFDGTTHELTLSGTARHATNITLAPEYAGAVLTGSGSGSNIGTMSSDFCSNTAALAIATTICPTSGDVHNYYSWTTNQATPQDYDIYVRYQVPSDFGGLAASNPLSMFGWVSSTGNDAVQLSVYKGGVACSTGTNVATLNNSWTSAAISAFGTCTITAGDVLTFQVHLKSGVSGDYARAGEITFSYFSKY